MIDRYRGVSTSVPLGTSLRRDLDACHNFPAGLSPSLLSWDIVWPHALDGPPSFLVPHLHLFIWGPLPNNVLSDNSFLIQHLLMRNLSTHDRKRRKKEVVMVPVFMFL